MVWLGLLLLGLVCGAGLLFAFGRVEEIAARLDYMSEVVNYLWRALGQSELSEISDELSEVVNYCEVVPEEVPGADDDSSSDDGSKEDVQC